MAQVKAKDFGFYRCATANSLQDAYDHVNSRGKFDQRNPDLASVPGPTVARMRDKATASSGCTGGARNGCYEIDTDVTDKGVKRCNLA